MRKPQLFIYAVMTVLLVWIALPTEVRSQAIGFAFDSSGNLKVNVNAALAAGTNAIGKLAANSGVDIGDVDVTSVSGTVTTTGNKTNNNAAPGATNVGVLPCIANASTPSWTEGNLVGCSVALDGSMRVSVANGSATDANSYAIITPMATATATGAALECAILSAASTNSTNCKNAAGNFYGFDIINTTTTTYYLRLYNTSSAPTCSSSSGFIRSIPIPPAAASGQAGGVVRISPLPVNYATGISYCLTAGSANNDNNSAVTGIFGAILYK